MLKSAVYIAHDIISRALKPFDNAIDATVGNAKDTLFLAEKTEGGGTVFGFDIQEKAVVSAKNYLRDKNNVVLIHDGHENMLKYIDLPIKAVMFNLGFLPGGDHKIFTKPDTTIKAINAALSLLVKNGVVTIVIYYGGDNGDHEKEEILKYLKNLDYKKYSVLVHDYINQVNCPPICAVIEKLYERQVNFD